MNYINALTILSAFGAEENLSNEECSEYSSTAEAFNTLGGDATLVNNYCDYFEDNFELPQDFYDPQQDDDKPEYEDWQDYCHEENRNLIENLLCKFGIMVGWKIRVPEDTDIVIRTAYEHCHDYGRVLVYLKDNEDTEEREEDFDHIYEETTIEDAVNDAVKTILDAKSSAHQMKVTHSIIVQCGSLY